MARPPQPIFLEKWTYRRNRLFDLAKFLPFVGGFLFLLPVLWPRGDDAVSTSQAAIYLFASWGGMIVAARLLTWALGRMAVDADGGD